MSVQPSSRRSGIGTITFAIILVVFGAYYLLRNTFGLDLPQLESEQVLPALAIIIGVMLLVRVWMDRRA
jgi:sugar phosphate permease